MITCWHIFVNVNCTGDNKLIVTKAVNRTCCFTQQVGLIFDYKMHAYK